MQPATIHRLEAVIKPGSRTAISSRELCTSLLSLQLLQAMRAVRALAET